MFFVLKQIYYKADVINVIYNLLLHAQWVGASVFILNLVGCNSCSVFPLAFSNCTLKKRRKRKKEILLCSKPSVVKHVSLCVVSACQDGTKSRFCTRCSRTELASSHSHCVVMNSVWNVPVLLKGQRMVSEDSSSDTVLGAEITSCLRFLCVLGRWLVLFIYFFIGWFETPLQLLLCSWSFLSSWNGEEKNESPVIIKHQLIDKLIWIRLNWTKFELITFQLKPISSVFRFNSDQFK